MSDLEKITHLDGLMIESGASKGEFNPNTTLNPPTVSDAQKGKLKNTNDTVAPIKKGTIIYNPDSNGLQSFQGGGNGAWVSLGAGGGAGTVTSVGVTLNGGLITNTGAAITGAGTLGLANTAVVAGTYNITGGDAGAIASITVDAQGRITAVTVVA